MTAERLHQITSRYAAMRIAVVGDFCLDRYLEIDPERGETSIETGLAVHNVVSVRSQPGGAGTILNNLVALGIGDVFPVGFCGFDGEGYELRRAMESKRGVRMDHFFRTSERRTFTYCKPLVMEPDRPPRELNRLDSKNWTATPESVTTQTAEALGALADEVDAMILLDQVDVAETGVITRGVLEVVSEVAARHPDLLIIADSRRSLKGYPPVCLKMNGAELTRLNPNAPSAELARIKTTASELAKSHGREVFVTLSERGIVGATPHGVTEHAAAFPVTGPIDVVGAGDAVTANLAAALGSGASLREALELSMAAASVVVHQLGTTGTATIADLARKNGF